MDPIEPISPIQPLRPVWPVPRPYDPAFPPGTFPNRTLPQWPGKEPHEAPPEDGETPLFVPPEPQAPLVATPVRDLRHVLLEAGVHGIGPVGQGFELGARELSGEVHYAYRHIAKSLMDVLADHHELPAAILASVTADGRDEREVGLLLDVNPKLLGFFSVVINPGVLNRWQRLGKALREQLEQIPLSVIGDLHLVEAPTHRWHP